MECDGVRVVRLGDPEYPSQLAEIDDAPRQLWVRGRSLEDLGPCVAVVGSRTPTAYGEQIAEDLAADLAAAGVCVVSGLARGADGAAHRGALKPENGRTIAVLGTGIEVCHPKSHRKLAERVAERGALVTEFPPQTPGWPKNFRQRNRIISGLSLGVVVVQAAAGSGALITSGYALDQQREVFAVPGNVDVEGSAGPNGLIKEGARLCTGAGDVFEVLRQRLDLSPAAARTDLRRAADLAQRPPAQQALLTALGRGGRSIESAAIRAGLGAREALQALVRLEIDGLVARMPGGGWRRV
jgi:DNA processing protein